MLQSIILKNFRSITKNEFSFWEERTIIHWKNGSWKTTVLEAISLLSITPLNSTKLENLVSLEWENFFVSAKLYDKNMSFAYNKLTKKKVYSIEWKSVAKKKFMSESLRITSFTPTTMNMFLLGPSKRRDFLDHILKSSYFQYDTQLKKYEKVLKNRNAILKSINKWNSSRLELNFWDWEFINEAINIYRYRYVIVSYFKKHIHSLDKFIPQAATKCDLLYKISVDFDNIEASLSESLEKNLERDILLWKTTMWPHLDDFSILINRKELIEFASRWEMKSIIVWLKILEAEFIELKTGNIPLLLIDDFMSELDVVHRELLLESFSRYQTIITNIEKINGDSACQIEM